MNQILKPNSENTGCVLHLGLLYTPSMSAVHIKVAKVCGKDYHIDQWESITTKHDHVHCFASSELLKADTDVLNSLFPISLIEGSWPSVGFVYKRERGRELLRKPNGCPERLLLKLCACRTYMFALV